MASRGQRFLAGLVDTLLPLPAAFALLLVVPSFLVTLIALGGFWFWNVLRQGNTGQTIGQRLFGLVLVCEDGSRYIGAGLALRRAFFQRDLGWFTPGWNDSRQSAADKLAGTVVVVMPDERPEWVKRLRG